MSTPINSMEHAATLTYSSAAVTGALWLQGHVPEIAMCVSAAASVAGVAAQIVVARAKVKMMQRYHASTLAQAMAQRVAEKTVAAAADIAQRAEKAVDKQPHG